MMNTTAHWIKDTHKTSLISIDSTNGCCMANIKDDVNCLFVMLDGYEVFFERNKFIRDLDKHYPDSITVGVFTRLLEESNSPVYSNGKGDYLILVNPHEVYKVHLNHAVISTYTYVDYVRKNYHTELYQSFTVTVGKSSLVIHNQKGQLFYIDFNKLIMG